MLEPADFQQAFGAALVGGPNPWTGDAALSRALAVHRNTSARAAQDALAANYPVILALVGDEAFYGCAAAYVEAHPPSDPRLCFYGEGFDLFLGSYAAFGELTYLTDVAQLERLCTEALFAADAIFFDGQALDLDARLYLHPAACIAHFSSPAVAIWLAHQADATSDNLEIDDWNPSIALVTRPDGVRVTQIDEATRLLLKHCDQGDALGVAAAAAVDAGGDLSIIFSTLILSGAFQNSNT